MKLPLAYGEGGFLLDLSFQKVGHSEKVFSTLDMEMRVKEEKGRG